MRSDRHHSRPLRFVLRVAAALLAVLGLGYTAICALMYASQDELLYPGYGHVSGPPAADGPPIQVVTLDTPDGERLVGWWLPPQPGQPTFLMFNGNGVGLAADGARWAELSLRGAGFLTVAYRGYDGSTGRPREADLIADAHLAYDWLAERVPPSDIIIEGFSLGSGVAVALAADRPARALVLEAPYSAIVDVAAATYPWLPVRLFMRDRFLSRDRIGRVDMPVLIVHGDHDTVVPIEQGRALYALARSPKRFVRVPGAGHGGFLVEVYDQTWSFLNLPRPADASAPSVAAVEVRNDAA